MRQWELFGITDADPSAAPGQDWQGPEDVHGTFFWSTDAALRFRTMSEAAGAVLGRDPVWCEGRDLLTTFGIEGTNLSILEAHTEALSGREGRFTLEGEGGRVRCRVAPTHAGDGTVIGTFCLAIDDEGPVEARAHELVAVV